MLFFTIDVANVQFSLTKEEENTYKIKAYDKSFMDKEVKECFSKAHKYVLDHHIPIDPIELHKVYLAAVKAAKTSSTTFVTDRIHLSDINNVDICVQNDAGKYTLWLKSGFSTSWDLLPVNEDPNDEAYIKAVNLFNEKLAQKLENELEKLKALEEKAIELIKNITPITTLYKGN